MSNYSELKFFVPANTKKIRRTEPYETIIKIDNTHGGEDLVDLSFYYLQYGTLVTKTELLSNKVKVGKAAEFKLKSGSNPTAFFLLWKANSFFRWFGEPNGGSTIWTDVEATWRVDEVDGLRLWGGGVSGSGTKP